MNTEGRLTGRAAKPVKDGKMNIKPLNDYVLLEVFEPLDANPKGLVAKGTVICVGPLAGANDLQVDDEVIYLRRGSGGKIWIGSSDLNLWMVRENDIMARVFREHKDDEPAEVNKEIRFERDEFIDISNRAARMADIEGINPSWRLAFQALDLAADHLDAMMVRAEEGGEWIMDN